jgi:hypothetical protein
VNTTRRCARPFPWAAIESLARSEVELLRDVRGWAVGRVRLDAIGSSLARILRTQVEVLVRRAGALGNAAPFDDAIGVLLAPADTPRPDRAVLIEAERGLAAAVVSRVLQREPATVVNPAPALSPTLAGAFAATVVAAARRAHLRTALRVLSAGPCGAIEAEIGRAATDPVVVELTVLVGDSETTPMPHESSPRETAFGWPGPPSFRRPHFPASEASLSRCRSWRMHCV